MANDTRLTISDNISSAIPQKLRAIGTAARAAHKNVEVLKTALAGLSNAKAAFTSATAGATAFRTAARGATTAVNALRTANNQTAASFKTLASGSRSATTSLNTLARGADSYHRNALSGSYATHRLVGALAAVAGVRAFSRHADDAINMRNQIRLVVGSEEELEAVQKRLFKLAVDTRSDLTATTKLYTRLRQNLSGVITDQEEFWKMTETLNKAVIATGRTTGEATASILQFTQAMAKGKLDGDEFRSILENLPILGKALEKQLKVTRGELYELAPAGKITMEAIRGALKLMANDVEVAFLNTDTTIGQALTNLSTKFTHFMSQNSASFNVIIGLIHILGDSLGILIPLVVAFGVAWATVQVIQVARDFIFLTGALIAYAPAIGAATLATANFTLGVIAGVAALYAIAAAVAIATGQYEEFKAWIENAATGVVEFAKNMVGMGDGINKASGEFLQMDQTVQQANVALGDSKKKLEELTKASSDVGETGVSSFQGVVRQVNQYGNTLDQLLAKLRRVNAEQAALTGGGSSRGKGDSLVRYTGASSFRNVGAAPAAGSKDSSIIGSYAKGGSFTVKGKSGVDRNLARFRVSNGERVDILTKAQQRAQANDNGGGQHVTNFYMNVKTPDYDSFRRSRRQLSGDMAAMVSATQ